MTPGERVASDGPAWVPSRLVICAAGMWGFFAGTAVVLLHPLFLALASHPGWQLRELVASSLGILPATMAIAIGTGATCGACYSCLRPILPAMSGRMLRVIWSAWSVALYLTLVFVYDAKAPAPSWRRALLWAVIALVLAAASDAVASSLWGWLTRGELKRAFHALILAGMLVWIPVLFCLALR